MEFPPSWYHLNAPYPPSFPSLDEATDADVCIVGGGFAGLSAALHLAESGTNVIVLEAGKLGFGASGRNGGQMHSGQRREILWLEKQYGLPAAKLFWQIGEDAKDHIRSIDERSSYDLQLRSGLIHSVHAKSLISEAREEVEALRERYGYDQASVLERDEIRTALGSDRYLFGIRDMGAGHLNPYHLVLSLIELGQKAGVRYFENSPALKLNRNGQKIVSTRSGSVRCDQILVTTNGRSNGFEEDTRRRAIGINSFIAVTEPLGALGDTIFPGGECSDDSFFVVRYWRKTPDNRLLLGGGECNAGHIPTDIEGFVRPHILDIYPELSAVPIAYAWGGVVSITTPRMPYIGALGPGIMAAAGFSGQGVALAPYVGRLLAKSILSENGTCEEIDLYRNISIPKLPAMTFLRRAMITLAIWRGRFKDRFT